MDRPVLVNVLGIDFTLADGADDAASRIVSSVLRRESGSYLFANAYGISQCAQDDQLREAYRAATAVFIDGAPIAWIAHWKTKRPVGRSSGPDVMSAVLRRTAGTGLTHFFYGSDNHTLGRLVDRVRKRYPGVGVAGSYSPPFGPSLDAYADADVARINETNADFLWIGLGTPKQDIWILKNRRSVRCAAVLAVGAAFDFEAGTLRRAPSILAAVGLEWAFRLAMEPKRLWRRYLVGNVRFLVMWFRSAVGDWR